MLLPSVLAAALLLAPTSPAPARTAPELRTTSSHPMKYYVSRPRGFGTQRTWPILVVIPDAGREFLGNLNTFVEAAREAPFVLVAPLVLTCGRPFRGNPPYPYDEAAWREADRTGDFQFDADGIAAMLDDVRRLDRGEERAFLTGWEAGGHTVWALLFQRPEAFRAVAPVSTNYRGRFMSEESFSRSAYRATLPLRVLFCGPQEGDVEAGRQHCLAQTREAMKVAEAHGFRDLTLRVVEGRPHGPLAADVLRVFLPFLPDTNPRREP